MHMEVESSRRRSISDNDDGRHRDEFNKKSLQKKLRFPKGKKLIPGDEVVANASQVAEDETDELDNIHFVSQARAKQRDQSVKETGNLLDDVADSKMHYEDNKELKDDGVSLEPFNLEQERKEGYFDDTGNYVEYVTNDIKNACLDSIDADPNLAQRHSVVTDIVAEAVDLTSEDIGTIKRQNADVLEPGETVLHALRRLKVTEDPIKLMEDGVCNVYGEKQGVFEREAEGFEKLVSAIGEGTSSSGMHAAENTTNNEEEDFDILSENDDENATFSSPNGAGATQHYCVFDESSGYYYSSMGYFYDLDTGFYCNAASGKWYSYDEEKGKYYELPTQ